MSLTELFKENFIDISLDTEQSILIVDWKGYQSVSSVQQGCERMLYMMSKHDAHRILNDNTKVLGIWIGAAEWLADNWFPRMAKSGMQRFAWVYSPARFSQFSTDGTLALLDSEDYGIQTFHNRADALAWLATP